MAKTADVTTTEETEEEVYAQYQITIQTLNITVNEGGQVNMQVGKPAPFPPPQ